MQNGNSVVVKVTFKDVAGVVTTAPEGVQFVSAVGGVDTLTFNPTANTDMTYDLTVSGISVGTDAVSANGLAGSLAVTVAPGNAVSVSFSPAEV